MGLRPHSFKLFFHLFTLHIMTLFSVTNGKDLSWEGFANSIEEVRAIFPNGQITEFKETEFPGIYEC